MWTLFKYENGSNPYIAKTEEEKKKILIKYKNKIVKIDSDYFLIKEDAKNKNTGVLFPLF